MFANDAQGNQKDAVTSGMRVQLPAWSRKGKGLDGLPSMKCHNVIITDYSSYHVIITAAPHYNHAVSPHSSNYSSCAVSARAASHYNYSSHALENINA
jgi:hypothetical protein